jgi:hypothetical protein
MLSFFCVSINAEFQIILIFIVIAILIVPPIMMKIRIKIMIGKSERPDFRPASLDDEVYTPSPRRSEGRRDQLGGAVRAAPRAKPLCQP